MYLEGLLHAETIILADSCVQWSCETSFKSVHFNMKVGTDETCLDNLFTPRPPFCLKQTTDSSFLKDGDFIISSTTASEARV